VYAKLLSPESLLMHHTPLGSLALLRSAGGGLPQTF